MSYPAKVGYNMLDKVILKNIASLFSIKIAGYLVPLISLPYLVRVLEPAGYGYLGYCLAINQYFILAVNYGFDLSATQKISRVENDKRALSQIFWNVIFARIAICFVGSIVLFISVNIFSSLQALGLILSIGYLGAIGAALFPQWLFQGKERLGSISSYRVFLQVASLPFLLLFVQTSEDVWKAALIQTLPSLLICFISFVIIVKRKWISWFRPDLRTLFMELRDGWHIFISTAAISLYTTSVVVILGAMCGPISVGLFVAANKIIQAANGLYTPISHAFYPRINKKISEDINSGLLIIHKLIKILFCITFVISTCLFFFSDIIINILFGSDYEGSVTILRIMSILPILTSMSNIFGVQTLLVFGYKSSFSKVLMLSGFVSLILIWPLTYFYNEVGASISVVLTELLVAVLMLLVVLRRNIPIFNREYKNV